MIPYTSLCMLKALSLYCCLMLSFSPSLCCLSLSLTPLLSLSSCSYLPPSISLGSKATLPWHLVWVLSARQSGCLWARGQSKSVEADAKRPWHYITWQRSSSRCTEMDLSTYSGTRGATVQLSNTPLMVPAVSIHWSDDVEDYSTKCILWLKAATTCWPQHFF